MKKKRIVIKIGTAVLTYPSGILNENVIRRLVKEIESLLEKGNEIILVTSGAIGAGLGKLNLKGRSISARQVLASIGQSHLMGVYGRCFAAYDRLVGQVLLTGDDLSSRERYLNARNTIMKLLDLGVIPIINENDTVAVEEIKFGDNDFLSALVAAKVEADMLILLSDVDGFYERDPRMKENPKLIREIRSITPGLERRAGGKGTERGTGGMISKLNAARIATACGIDTFIANGKKKGVLSGIIDGKPVGTRFLPCGKKLILRENLIAFEIRKAMKRKY